MFCVLIGGKNRKEVGVLVVIDERVSVSAMVAIVTIVAVVIVDAIVAMVQLFDCCNGY